MVGIRVMEEGRGKRERVLGRGEEEVSLRRSSSTWLALVMLLKLKCCFTSTETVGLLGTGAQDGHLDFHTGPELGFHW